jgi:hypothetical protein
MKTKLFKVATYFKVMKIEKKTILVEAYDEEEALHLCEVIGDKQLNDGIYWDDVEVIDSFLPNENISSMWIEENDDMTYPNYDPFAENGNQTEAEPKLGTCAKHGSSVELWIGCNHILHRTASTIDFARDDSGGTALCFTCLSDIENWDRQKFLDSMKTVCKGCLQDIVMEMSKGKTKEQLDKMFFGLELL